MKKTIALFITCVVALAAVPAMAETRRTNEYLFSSVQDVKHFLRLVDFGFSDSRALQAVNLSVPEPEGSSEGQDWKGFFGEVEWDDEQYIKAGTYVGKQSGKGASWTIVELTDITKLRLFGKWRDVPDWMKGWRYAFFDAKSPFLNKNTSSVEPT